MLQRLKQRVTKLESASDAIRPPMPRDLFSRVVDEAIELLPLPAWEWVLQITSPRRTRTGQAAESRFLRLSEHLADWTALTYGLRLHETYSQAPNYWIVAEVPKSIPYLMRCSRRELTVLSPSERDALLAHVSRLIEPRVLALTGRGELREVARFTESLVDLQLSRVFDPFRKRYARALEEQRQAVPLPEIAETDSLEEKRITLGNWFRSRWAEKRRAYASAET